jgi:hypothetical protein
MNVASLNWGIPKEPGLYVMDWDDWHEAPVLVTVKKGEDCEGDPPPMAWDLDGPVGSIGDLIQDGALFFGPIPPRG